MEQEVREKILESTHIPKEIWYQCIVTSDGQVFTPNDETGESAEEVYNKHLSNIGKETPNQIEVLMTKVSELEIINAGVLLDNANQNVELQQQKAKVTEQESITSGLLLEVALLKGVV